MVHDHWPPLKSGPILASIVKEPIFILEDIAEMAELMRLYLVSEGWEVVHFFTAEAALEALEAGAPPPQLVILDLNLPGMDGFAFLDRFRKNHSAPVLIVSARAADEDIITGLGYGADEFVTKPFSPRVLVARVRALLRRAQGPSDGPALVSFGPYTFDGEACLVKKGAERIALSNKEYALLAFLVAQDGRPAGPETIYRQVWKNAYGDLTAVAVYIQRLRRKLEEDPGHPVLIETIPGQGYRLAR